MHLRRFLISPLLAFTLCTGTITPATSLERMSIARMARAARMIVRARCVANSVRWDAGEIWTFTSFNIEDAWKGAAQARVIVRLLGGKLGDLTSSVSGVPHFRPDEEVVLFLEPTSRGDFSIVSWMQGTLRIRIDPRTKQENATQDTAAFATFNLNTRHFESTGLIDIPLESLREEVATALKESGGEK
jgi:hypothetical protein